MIKSMAAYNGREIPKEDKVFAASGKALDAVSKYGPEKVINATVGALYDDEGKLLVLVSASTENYMRFVADTLGFDTVLCTPIEADGTIRRNCKGEKKTQRIKDWLAENGLTADFPSSFAYGDSKSDLPMLRLVGHPVQVNPKKALRELAPEMNLIHWK